MEPGNEVTPLDPPLLEAASVHKHYRTSRSSPAVRALDGVTVEVRRSRPVGIAGESGSGKSTLMRLLLGLEPPTSGEVRFEGANLDGLEEVDTRGYRRSVQAVFQDPGSSLDPRRRIWRSITEPVWIAEGLSSGDRRSRAASLLEMVGLPAAYADRYPHQLSGGECQRVAVARSLSSNPRVVILDEPVTSLDVSVRAQILNLLSAQAHESDVTYMVISHDLTAIYYLTDYMYILYHGLVVEEGPTVDLIHSPLHPYTEMLVASIGDPLFDSGTPGDDAPAPEGACPYMHRCPRAFDRCVVQPPPSVGPTPHPVRCWLHAGAEDAPIPPGASAPVDQPSMKGA